MSILRGSGASAVVEGLKGAVSGGVRGLRVETNRGSFATGVGTKELERAERERFVDHAP